MNPAISQRIREQFNQAPYPQIPVESIPDRHRLCKYNIVNAFYRRDQRVVRPQGKAILDVGCGSGYTSLCLALANPEAHIVGIDISETSIELAKARLTYHGFSEMEFYVMAVEELGQLEQKFDYINCDETLYLLPDPLQGLQAMAGVLAQQGIIRANLHHGPQRRIYFQAQELFNLLGFMEDCEQETAIGAVRELFASLLDHVHLKRFGWAAKMPEDGAILSNHLLRGDRGFTVNDTFALIASSNLAFISLVDPLFWRLEDLFSSPSAMPDFMQMVLNLASEQELLHLYELINPVHRLLDFYCGHSQMGKSYQSPATWETEQWQDSSAYLHPQLQDEQVKEGLLAAIANFAPFNASQYLNATSPQNISLLPPSSFMLYLLLTEGKGEALTFQQILNLWQETFPVNPITRSPMTADQLREQVRRVLIDLEELQFVFLVPV